MSKLKPTKSATFESENQLQVIEAKYRRLADSEIVPYAINTPYFEIASNIIRPRPECGTYKYKLIKSYYYATTGLQQLLMKIKDYYEIPQQEGQVDILSISGNMEDDFLYTVVLLRLYGDYIPNLKKLNIFLGVINIAKEAQTFVRPQLTEDTRKLIQYSDNKIREHKNKILRQNEKLQNSSEEQPFLNSIDEYVPEELPKYENDIPPVYRLKELDKQIVTVLPYSKFIEIFNEAIKYITTIEMDDYYSVLRGRSKKDGFMQMIEEYLNREFILKQKVLPVEDVPVLIAKLNKALFELYIVQDLIDDPDITDVKITSSDSIRVRIKGKAYLSDINFVNDADYIRFVNAIIIRNNIDTSVPEQTFTDVHDEGSILRFTITMPYITASNMPILHIRKISRKKLLGPDLIAAGMFDKKIHDYLLDCGKNSNGVVFAGAPGSGKTICLNWFLEEAYEDSAEILVIQENDELFSYKKGIMFQHVVVNPVGRQRACSLEDLGQLALVAGANVFVIGEAKGAEICSAITLSNSGCRTALTVHSRSSIEAIDKMADLAMRGYAESFEQAKRMMKSFQTIVFLKDFKVWEISEVIGYDEEKHDIIYRPIYRREKEIADEKAK